MKAFDIDGTLLDYDYIPGAHPKVNLDLLSSVQGETIALVTNQGGLPFGVMGAKRKDGRGYPQPFDFARRVNFLLVVCRDLNIKVSSLQVCVYHPKAQPEVIELVTEKLDILLGMIMFAEVWVSENERKPSPFMLEQCGATSYYGDSTEDEQAANAAGIPFFRVERFF